MANPLQTATPKLVLASSSRYRAELLSRLRLTFVCDAPELDETPHAGETPPQTAMRLAMAKARAVAARHADALVIGSDQVAICNGMQLGKPGNHARALAQLQQMRGQRIVFHTAVCLVDGRSTHTHADALEHALSQHATPGQQVSDIASGGTGLTAPHPGCLTADVLTTVTMRDLDDATLDAYLHAEKPYDVAGSAKVEGLGIALLEAVHSDDPTALIGLPLITVSRWLVQAGMPLFSAPACG